MYNNRLIGGNGTNELDDYSLMISKDGNALKAELDDPSNKSVMDIHIANIPVTGNMGDQVATNNPIESLIGEITDAIKGIFNTIGGIL
jgi:hypothetical protein